MHIPNRQIELRIKQSRILAETTKFQLIFKPQLKFRERRKFSYSKFTKKHKTVTTTDVETKARLLESQTLHNSPTRTLDQHTLFHDTPIDDATSCDPVDQKEYSRSIIDTKIDYEEQLEQPIPGNFVFIDCTPEFILKNPAIYKYPKQRKNTTIKLKDFIQTGKYTFKADMLKVSPSRRVDKCSTDESLLEVACLLLSLNKRKYFVNS